MLTVFIVLAKCFFFSSNWIWCVNHKCDNIAISDFCQNSAWMQSWLLFYLFIYLLFMYFFLFKFDILLLGSGCFVTVKLYSYRVVVVFIIYWFVCFLQNVQKNNKKQTEEHFWFVLSVASRVSWSSTQIRLCCLHPVSFRLQAVWKYSLIKFCSKKKITAVLTWKLKYEVCKSVFF